LTAKVEVKPGHKDGFSNFSYGPLSANLDYANNEAQQIHVSITFGGVPQSLTPGQEFTVTVGVSVTSQPAAIAANWAVNGSVEAAGLEVVSAQSAGAKRPGNYVFRVPLNAASATITLHGDFGGNNPAALHRPSSTRGATQREAQPADSASPPLQTARYRRLGTILAS
jgi:hypothetical protein